MERIKIIDEKSNMRCIIHSRTDSFNTIEVYKDNFLAEFYKTRLESLVLKDICEKLQYAISNKKRLIVGYPTFLFEYEPSSGLNIKIFNTDNFYTIHIVFSYSESLEIIGE